MRSLIAIALLIPAIVADGELKACYAPYQPVYDLAAEKCLATMVYGEARGEPEQGMVAVAYTAVNRAAKKTVCNVVLAPKQYSIFNNNPVLKAAAMSLDVDPHQKNVIEEAAWEQSVKVAQAVLRKEVPDPTFGSTHYLAPALMKIKGYKFPKWSREYKLVAVINSHKFYRKL